MVLIRLDLSLFAEMEEEKETEKRKNDGEPGNNIDARKQGQRREMKTEIEIEIRKIRTTDERRARENEEKIGRDRNAEREGRNADDGNR